MSASTIEQDGAISDRGIEQLLAIAKLRAHERVTEQGHGRQPAICELTCPNCGDGIRFDSQQCATCGERNPRYGA